MHQLQLTPTKLVPCGVALRYLNCRPCSRNVCTCKRFLMKKLDKEKGFKRGEIPGLVNCKFLTKSMRSIQSDVNKNLVLTIRN